MSSARRVIRRVAVLGAGVMGAQIAAHCANAGLEVVLFDLPAKEGHPHGIVKKSLDQLLKLEPAPFSEADNASLVIAADYDHDLELLKGCDLIIEAIAERLDWKEALYAKVAPYVSESAILASNTSGLSINALAQVLPEALRPRFCAVHFFNPPRYLSLVELIPARDTMPAILDDLESWVTTRLGKNVIRAKDTPNFIANRVGIFSMIAVMYHADRLGLGFDLVDALTGPKIGRARSATYRTADVVGLDTLAHVMKTMENGLTPESDPWHPTFGQPAWLKALIEKGSLGQKTRCGIFQKVGKEIQVYRPDSGHYEAQTGKISAEVDAILAEKDWAKRFDALRASSDVQAQFLWAIFRDLFHYCAYHLESIAESAREIDCALRWGFAWSMGPFEIWQAAGWHKIAEAIQSDVEAGAAMVSSPLPAWVMSIDGAHGAEGSYDPSRHGWAPRSSLPVYARQVFPERLLGETVHARGPVLWEHGDAKDGVTLWHLPEIDARVGILSFKSKMNSVSHEVLAGVLGALDFAERELDALVLWNPAPFSVGANLKQVLASCEAQEWDVLDQMIRQFQTASTRLRDAVIPTVAAVSGLAYGGGLEFAMHTRHRVVALETQLGLVETAVGVIPAGGGCRVFALQALEWARRAQGADLGPYVDAAFKTISHAEVARNAHQAIRMGFLKPSDDVVFHPAELLHAAIHRARGLAEVGAGAPRHSAAIQVAGRAGLARLEAQLTQLKEGGQISEHDVRVSRAAAVALCGGDVDPGTVVDEQWLLDMERIEFVALLKEPLTQARIAHMLEHGKALRN